MDLYLYTKTGFHKIFNAWGILAWLLITTFLLGTGWGYYWHRKQTPETVTYIWK